MLINQIKEEIRNCASRNDLKAWFGTILFSREFQVLCIYRIARSIRLSSRGLLFLQPLRWLMGIISGCEISPKAAIGRRLRLPHPSNIIIGEGAVVGDNVTFYHGVTLGQKAGRDGVEAYPTVENSVTVYANSSLLGGIVVGEGSVIGAHSLVLKTFPKHSRIAGVPARSLAKA